MLINKVDKLKELTKRAISINKVLLAEEEKFVEALSGQQDVSDLREKHDKIRMLIRKELLYHQVASKVLETNENH
jgi:hypothetical protein